MSRNRGRVPQLRYVEIDGTPVCGGGLLATPNLDDPNLVYEWQVFGENHLGAEAWVAITGDGVYDEATYDISADKDDNVYVGSEVRCVVTQNMGEVNEVTIESDRMDIEAA